MRFFADGEQVVIYGRQTRSGFDLNTGRGAAVTYTPSRWDMGPNYAQYNGSANYTPLSLTGAARPVVSAMTMIAIFSHHGASNSGLVECFTTGGGKIMLNGFVFGGAGYVGWGNETVGDYPSGIRTPYGSQIHAAAMTTAIGVGSRVGLDGRVEQLAASANKTILNGIGYVGMTNVTSAGLRIYASITIPRYLSMAALSALTRNPTALLDRLTRVATARSIHKRTIFVVNTSLYTAGTLHVVARKV